MRKFESFRDASSSLELLREYFAHGCFLVCLDGIGVGSSFLSPPLKQKFFEECQSSFPEIFAIVRQDFEHSIVNNDDQFGIAPFFVPKQTDASFSLNKFEFSARTTKVNLLRVLRALQLSRAILLEGSPGVGKTSLIDSLCKVLGRKLHRINLSEQTDFSDLIGSDLPNSNGGFDWMDGVLLKALKNGDWVLLDELNLASQTVLEGLNSILDHRSSVYVPELNQTFQCPKDFRIFASQNPINQGGGRKGLPKSFLNRFTKVYVEQLTGEDFLQISKSIFTNINESIIDSLVQASETLQSQMSLLPDSGEFNLRDIFRFFQLLQVGYSAPCIFELLYTNRFGIYTDLAQSICLKFFGEKVLEDDYSIQYNENSVIFGTNCEITKLNASNVDVASQQLDFPLELNPFLINIARCVKQSWPCLIIGEKYKSLILKRLSQVLGRKLLVLQMTSATDATELLGCYEQNDSVALKAEVLNKLSVELRRELNFHIESVAVTLDPTMAKEQLFSAKFFEICSYRDFLDKSLQAILVGNQCTSKELENLFDTGLKFLVSESTRENLRFNWETLNEEILHHRPGTPNFRWIDGILIKAMENGDWLVLDDANLCSPQVLDRLNSLLEDNCRELMINEQGSRIVHPNENFRIFLTCNPKFGLVSRAMRNRCVEIFLPSLPALDEKFQESKLQEEALKLSEIGIQPYPSKTLEEKNRILNYYFPTRISKIDFKYEDFVNSLKVPLTLLEETFQRFLSSPSILEEHFVRILKGEKHEAVALSYLMILLSKLPTDAYNWLNEITSKSCSPQIQLVCQLMKVNNSKFEDLIETKLKFFQETLKIIDETMSSADTAIDLATREDITILRDDFFRVCFALQTLQFQEIQSSLQEKIQVTWRRLMKKLSSYLESNVHLDNATRRFDSTLKVTFFHSQDSNRKSSLLWKKGGHSMAPTDELSAQTRDFLVFTKKKFLDNDLTKNGQLLSIMVNLRYTGSGGGIGGKKMTSEVKIIRDKAIQLMNHVLESFIGMKTGDEIDGSIIEENPFFDENLKIISKRVSSLNELVICEQLARLSNGEKVDIPSLKETIEKLIVFNLKTSSKEIHELACYQEALLVDLQDPTTSHILLLECLTYWNSSEVFQNYLTAAVFQATKFEVSLKDRNRKSYHLRQIQYCLSQLNDLEKSAYEIDALMLSSLVSFTSRFMSEKDEFDLLQRCLSAINNKKKGTAWGYLGLLRYLCYLPKINLDPHSKQRVLEDLYLRRLQILDEKIEALKMFRMTYKGASKTSSDTEIRGLQAKKHDIELLLENMKSVPLYRDFERFFREVTTFSQSVGSIKRITRLFEVSNEQELVNFTQVVREFSVRLLEEYPFVCDFVYPIVSSLNLILHGLSLVRQKSITSNEAKMLSALFAWPRVQPSIQILSSDMIGPKFNTQVILSILPQIELSKLEDIPSYCGVVEHSKLREAFRTLTNQWRVHRKEEEQRRLLKEAQVRVKSVKEQDKDEEQIQKEREEKELKQMFPDFHREFEQDEIKQDEDKMEEEDSSIVDETEDLDLPSQKEGIEFQALTPDEVEYLATKFIAIYSNSNTNTSLLNSRNNHEDLRGEVFTKTSQASSTLITSPHIVNKAEHKIWGDSVIEKSLLASNLFLVGKTLKDLKL